MCDTQCTTVMYRQQGRTDRQTATVLCRPGRCALFRTSLLHTCFSVLFLQQAKIESEAKEAEEEDMAVEEGGTEEKGGQDESGSIKREGEKEEESEGEEPEGEKGEEKKVERGEEERKGAVEEGEGRGVMEEKEDEAVIKEVEDMQTETTEPVIETGIIVIRNVNVQIPATWAKTLPTISYYARCMHA